jgi:ABC-type lipoprotein export system ATPase subunit
MEHKHHPLVGLRNVSKTFAEDINDYQAQVLKDISLEIIEGEYVMIFGPSGSGKSTMLNLLAGLEAPTHGKVLVRGRDLSHYDSERLARYHRLKTGMVFQSFNLLKSLNCWENVALPMAANGARYGFRKKRALQLMKQFGLSEYANRQPSEISGGEQQRLAIARALVNHPFLLLVDEPTGNLDSKAAGEVMEIFRNIHEKKEATIIMVTHNPEHLQYASRVIYMQDGAVVNEEVKTGGSL